MYQRPGAVIRRPTLDGGAPRSSADLDLLEERTSGGRLPMYVPDPRPRSGSQDPLRKPARLRSPSTEERDPLDTRKRTKSSLPWPLSKMRPRTRTVLLALKFLVPTLVLVLLVGWYLYELHIELALYPKRWIHTTIDPVLPLSGCFDEARVSPRYNLSQELFGPKYTTVQAGVPLRMGMDCYEFAGTIKSSFRPTERVEYHTYWRSDLAPFQERQEYTLKSFFATQDVTRSRLTLWSNGDLSQNPLLDKWVRRYPESFVLRVVDIHYMARETAIAGSPLLTSTDTKAWIDGDLVRLLLLWEYGGVWVDMDSLLTRDLAPLLEHEFVSQWDCYDKIYNPLNGALMAFKAHSPYLCEAFHIMQTSPAPRPGSTDWGSLLYHKLFRRILAAGVPPFKVLPWCLSDARSCRLDNRLPDPFVPDRGQPWGGVKSDGSMVNNHIGREPRNSWVGVPARDEGGRLDDALSKIFVVHLHNQWEKAFPKDGWVDRLLLSKYERRLGT